MSTSLKTIAVLPALDEEGSLGEIVRGLRAATDAVVVVDNGSRDRAAEVAETAGAKVVFEPERGYGAACLAGVAEARRLGAGIILFLDGDGSDDPAEAKLLLAPILAGVADLVLGIRSARSTERGAQSLPQWLGNRLLPLAMRLYAGARCRDLPPFKAIRLDALDRLSVRERGHGFTAELLLRAHARRRRVQQVEVQCRRRAAGRSKASSSPIGATKAAARILWVIAREGPRALYADRSSR